MININDKNYRKYMDHPGMSKGLIPRDYSKYPVGYLMQAKPFDLPLIPRDQWQSIIDMKNATNSWLDDIRDRGMSGSVIPSRDQNGKGYCWAHSSTSAVLLIRALMNLPYSDLSAYAVACIIKNYKDQGGWGSESLEWIAENGIPSSDTWPQQSMSPKNDTPEMRAEAAQNKVTEWMDGQPRNIDQLVTCLLLNIPVVSDFNWWGHSVCSVRIIRINPLKTRIWNSWGDSWSENGMGDLEGNKCIPDGMIMPRVITPTNIN